MGQFSHLKGCFKEYLGEGTGKLLFFIYTIVTVIEVLFAFAQISSRYRELNILHKNHFRYTVHTLSTAQNTDFKISTKGKKINNFLVLIKK